LRAIGSPDIGLVYGSQSCALRQPAEVGKKLSVFSSQFSAFISKIGNPQSAIPAILGQAMIAENLRRTRGG